MAKYYTSVETIGAIDGVEEPIQVRNVTITNVDNGVWNGLFIEAKNFAIANGHLASEANETYVWNGLASDWTDGVDDEVEQVVFTNNGTIGTQDNTVNMAVTLKAFIPSESDLNINITLVESTVHPIYSASHPFVTSVIWDTIGDGDALHTVTTSTTHTETILTPTSADYSGTILTDDSSTVVLLTFAAIDYYYYDFNGPNPQPSGILGQSGLYSAQIEDQGYNDQNLLTSFKVRLEFNWNSFGEESSALQTMYADNYDTGGMWGSGLNISPLRLQPVPVAIVGDRIHSVSYPPSLASSQGEIPIRVFGSANAPYKLSIEKKTSTTSIVTASSNGYYNFDTRAFQTAVTSLDSTCDAKGVNVNYVLLPDASSDTRYDITVSGVVAGSTTVLNSNVPQKAGDAIITKYGVDTITIKPITYTSSNFGTLPANITVSKEKPIPGQSLSSGTPTSVVAKGGTGGSSSTRLVLNEKPRGIFAGMVVTGSGVAHNSTVSAISKNIVTLSGASTIANNTDIRFTTDTANLKPFTFTVVPNSNTLNVNTSADLSGSIGGLTSVKTQINGTATKTITHTVDSTKGIVPGMVVTGDEVKVDAGTDLTVASVTSGTVLVLSEIQTFVDNARLKFSGGNVNADTNLHSVQANKVGDNIVITGYVVSSNLKATADVRVYIDDIITVS
jgi:hypothetical protein